MGEIFTILIIVLEIFVKIFSYLKLCTILVEDSKLQCIYMYTKDKNLRMGGTRQHGINRQEYYTPHLLHHTFIVGIVYATDT